MKNLKENPDMKLSELSLSEFDELIAGMIKSHVDQMTPVDKKYGILPYVDAKAQQSMTACEKGREFLKALYGRDSATLKALTEGTDSQGGYLVPKEFTAEILRLVEDVGVFRANARVLPMSKRLRDVPVLSTGVSAVIVGENTQITESDAAFGNAQLIAKKLGAITAMSNELLDDSSVPLVQYLAEIFAEAIATLEDTQGFNGSGSGSNFTGALIASGVNTVNMASTKTDFEDVTYDNLVDVMSAVKSQALANAKWYMHRTIWAYILKLKDSQGMPIATNIVVQGNQGTLLGYPVRLVEQMPTSADTAVSTSFILFGDLKKACLLGDRQEVTIAISQDATIGSNNLFEKNMSGVRVLERVGIVTAVGAYLAKLKTAAS